MSISKLFDNKDAVIDRDELANLRADYKQAIGLLYEVVDHLEDTMGAKEINDKIESFLWSRNAES